MTDDFKTTPPEQPVSMHDMPHVHNHGALPLVAAMLGVFLVLESIALAYFVTNYVGIQNVQSSILEKKAESEDGKPLFPPFVYAPLSLDRTAHSVVAVNRQTGKEKTIYTSDDQIVTQVIVPQVAYDGRVFIGTQGEGDSPQINYWELSADNSSPAKLVSFAAKLPIPAEAISVSPDQTTLIALYGIPPDAPAGTQATVSFFNLLTGEETKLSSSALNSGEYFSEYYGDNVMNGMGGYHITWRDSSSAFVTIYQDGADPADNHKVYKETRLYSISDAGSTD